MKIKANYSTVCADELLQHVLPMYDISNPLKCDFWYRGLNDTYKVVSDCGSYALRVYRKNWRSLSDIKFEMEALQYLHDNNAKVSYPIRTIEGGYVTTIDAPEGERHIVLTKFIDGSPLKYDKASDTYGKAAANIHLTSSGFHSNHERYTLDINHLINEPISNILPFLSHRPDDAKFLEKFSQELSGKYKEAELNKLDSGFCHGDFHGGNAHDDNGDVYHFDFDCCGFGLRIFDLATFKWSSRLRQKEDEWWPEFLKGYRSQNTVSEIELSYIEVFVAIRDLWLFGLHTGNSKYLAKGWINNSYIDRRISFLKDASDRINNKSFVKEG